MGRTDGRRARHSHMRAGDRWTDEEEGECTKTGARAREDHVSRARVGLAARPMAHMFAVERRGGEDGDWFGARGLRGRGGGGGKGWVGIWVARSHHEFSFTI